MIEKFVVSPQNDGISPASSYNNNGSISKGFLLFTFLLLFIFILFNWRLTVKWYIKDLRFLLFNMLIEFRGRKKFAEEELRYICNDHENGADPNQDISVIIILLAVDGNHIIQ
jgi:hypothetical protein